MVRRKDVVILNIGGELAFERSKLAAQWLLSSFEVNTGSLRKEIFSTQDLNEATATALIPTTLLHVMGHGHGRGGIGDARASSMFWIRNLIPYCEEYDWLPEVDVLLLDACNTFSASWKTALAELLPPKKWLLFIGTTRSIDWHEATTFTSAFYSAAMLPEFPRDRDPVTRAQTLELAYDRASLAHLAIFGRPAPFKAEWIESSR